MFLTFSRNKDFSELVADYTATRVFYTENQVKSWPKIIRLEVAHRMLYIILRFLR